MIPKENWCVHSVFREQCREEENIRGEKNGEFTSGDDFDGDAVRLRKNKRRQLAGTV